MQFIFTSRDNGSLIVQNSTEGHSCIRLRKYKHQKVCVTLSLEPMLISGKFGTMFYVLIDSHQFIINIGTFIYYTYLIK